MKLEYELRIAEALERIAATLTDPQPFRVPAATKIGEWTPESVAAYNAHALHPNGRCDCGGEGRCYWCWRAENEPDTCNTADYTAASPEVVRACLDGATGTVRLELDAIRSSERERLISAVVESWVAPHTAGSTYPIHAAALALRLHELRRREEP